MRKISVEINNVPVDVSVNTRNPKKFVVEAVPTYVSAKVFESTAKYLSFNTQILKAAVELNAHTVTVLND